MKQIRKKALDKATEQAIIRATAAGIPMVFDRYEDMSPVCRFGQMALDCKACTQGPCRINPFDPSNGTSCGFDRESINAAGFLRMIADGTAVNASFAGLESEVAGVVFDAMVAANEGTVGPAQLLEKAIVVANAGFQALASSKGNAAAVREVKVGLGTLDPDRINILMAGNIPAVQAQKIAAELKSNGKVNLVGVAGGEAIDLNVAGNYNSEEAMLVTTGVDGVVIGKACVAPGFLALAARQGVPVVSADRFDGAELLNRADDHFRTNAGRTTAARFSPARALMGFTSGTFSSLSSARWARLADMGVKGVALVAGCNNVQQTQDAAVVRQATEFLKSDVLVVASGCAAVGLAKAGYMDPDQRDGVVGKRLRGFLAALSEASGTSVPAVMEAGTCWEIPAALELARLFQKQLKLPVVAAMPEVSRAASWSSALAIASQGVPTYVGPVLPLDGGLQTLNMLNEMLRAKGGALLGPGQLRDPEAVVNLVMSNG